MKFFISIKCYRTLDISKNIDIHLQPQGRIPKKVHEWIPAERRKMGRPEKHG